MATYMPNARLAQKEPHKPISNTLPPNAFAPSKILGWHERRLLRLEENDKTKQMNNVVANNTGPQLAILSERIDKLAELLESLSEKVAQAQATSDEEEDEQEENVELEVEENN